MSFELNFLLDFFFEGNSRALLRIFIDFLKNIVQRIRSEEKKNYTSKIQTKLRKERRDSKQQIQQQHSKLSKGFDPSLKSTVFLPLDSVDDLFEFFF